MGLARKLSKWVHRARDIARRDGVAALPKAIVRGLRFRLSNVWNREHFWQGRIVELMGNRWRVDGVTVHLDNTAIETPHKSLFFRGDYERPERELLRKHIPGDLPLIELGGCIGVVACIANRRLSDPERHVVVEANPRLIPTLERNRAANRARFRIVQVAIGYSGDTVSFEEGPFASGAVSERGAISVPARSLESVASEAGFERFDLICDIEGGEGELLRREGLYLEDHVRWLLVEMHPSVLGEESVRELDALLRDVGFELVERRQTVYCYRNSAP